MTETPQGSSYSPQPRQRRGNRRASGGSAFSGAEPKLAGLTDRATSAPSAPEEEDARAAWLKEQRPPHYQGCF